MIDPGFVSRIPIAGPDQDLLGELVDTWQKKRRRNLLRTTYYEGKQAFKNFGISVPPQLEKAFTPLMWVAKGVHAMTDRSQFEGFVSQAGGDDPYGVAGIVADNDFEVEFPQAVVSSAVHACSFLTVFHGDVQSGEPEVLVIPRAADASAALWDNRRRAVRGFLSVVEVSDRGEPVHMILYTPFSVYVIRAQRGGWVVDEQKNPLGEVGVAPLRLKPELNRPFGHSRITRSGMGFTDGAVRTILRTETQAEFYGADSFWLFGADVSQFVGDDKWSALMGRIKALDVEYGDEKPDLHHFSGSSPEPHVGLLRMFAAQFADDQGLEVKFVDASNPSSADAIYAAKEELIMDTRAANRTWGAGAVKAMQYAVRLRDGLDATPDEIKTLRAQFTDPAIVSPSARADAFSKLAANIEGFGNSEVGMEFAGLSQEQIRRFDTERRSAGAGSRIAALVEAARGLRADSADPATTPDGSAGGDAAAMKAKFDALGVAVRAGVDPVDAAVRLGLDGIKLTGAVPVSLRMPESEADGLEAK